MAYSKVQGRGITNAANFDEVWDTILPNFLTSIGWTHIKTYDAASDVRRQIWKSMSEAGDRPWYLAIQNRQTASYEKYMWFAIGTYFDTGTDTMYNSIVALSSTGSQLTFDKYQANSYTFWGDKDHLILHSRTLAGTNDFVYLGNYDHYHDTFYTYADTPPSPGTTVDIDVTDASGFSIGQYVSMYDLDVAATYEGERVRISNVITGGGTERITVDEVFRTHSGSTIIGVIPWPFIVYDYQTKNQTTRMLPTTKGLQTGYLGTTNYTQVSFATSGLETITDPDRMTGLHQLWPQLLYLNDDDESTYLGQCRNCYRIGTQDKQNDDVIQVGADEYHVILTSGGQIDQVAVRNP